MSSAVIVEPTTAMRAAVSSLTADFTCVLLVATPETARSRSGAPVIVFRRSTVGRQSRLFFPVLASSRRIFGTWSFDRWLARYCSANAPCSSRRIFVAIEPSVDVSGSSSATETYRPGFSPAFSRPIAAATSVSFGIPKS